MSDIESKDSSDANSADNKPVSDTPRTRAPRRSAAAMAEARAEKAAPPALPPIPPPAAETHHYDPPTPTGSNDAPRYNNGESQEARGNEGGQNQNGQGNPNSGQPQQQGGQGQGQGQSYNNDRRNDRNNDRNDRNRRRRHERGNRPQPGNGPSAPPRNNPHGLPVDDENADIGSNDRVINLTELKRKNAIQLLEFAESLGLQEGVARQRRQDVIFNVLKAHARSGGGIWAEGVLEILQDGFGFLRSAEIGRAHV